MAPSSPNSSNPMLIGIDWGSSNLRAALLDAQGTLIDRRESAAGVFTIKDGDFSTALLSLCGDWVAQYRVPVLACGMIGSKQGIVEVPYVACPAGVHDLARQLVRIEVLPKPESTGMRAFDLFIVPGLKTGSHANGWDVIRGEETQLFGVQLAPDSLAILPGTHSKWMTQGHGGAIANFQTYMTGELFELLRSHGSLARVMANSQWSPEAYQQGVHDARDDALENLSLIHI